jgi:hypothetical protein
MSERGGRKFFFWLHAILTVLSLLGLIGGVIPIGFDDVVGLLPFLISMLLFGATAMHLRP